MDVKDLDVSRVQGPSLPKEDPVHSLVDRRVRVTRGHFKGYNAHVKHVDRAHITVEIEGQLVSGGSAQLLQWHDVVILYVVPFYFLNKAFLIRGYKH